MAWPIYEVIDEHKLPVIFHTGHSGMGTGMRGGGGVRLKYGQPMLVDDVAVDFPDMKIILAHPSWPWTDESLSMALHKENVFIDLSGWSPKYFPKQVIQYANAQLKHKMLFGSDFPLIHPRQVDRGGAGSRLPGRGDAGNPQGQRRPPARSQQIAALQNPQKPQQRVDDTAPIVVSYNQLRERLNRPKRGGGAHGAGSAYGDGSCGDGDRRPANRIERRRSTTGGATGRTGASRGRADLQFPSIPNSSAPWRRTILRRSAPPRLST